jgi:hypothetical protein
MLNSGYKCQKDFEGVYEGYGIVYFISLKTGEAKEVYQNILLEVNKISDEVYFITFTELSPIPNLKFSCVATQSTENKLLLQSNTSGINSFYFIEEDGFNVLNANWNTPNDIDIFGSNIVQAASIKFYRK